VVRLSVSPYLKRSALEDLLQEVKLAWETGNCDEEALQIICDASSSDDSNLVTVWHAYDVAQNMSQQITAATTDDELAELATAAHAAAVEEMALIVGEMDKELA